MQEQLKDAERGLHLHFSPGTRSRIVFGDRRPTGACTLRPRTRSNRITRFRRLGTLFITPTCPADYADAERERDDGMATATASTSTAPYAPSTTSGAGVPRTQLPVDPHTLTRYLRSRQLAALRGLYEYKTLAVAQQIEQHAASLRGRHGRARRRRGSSPLEERDLDAEDEEDDLEVRKRMRYDPAADLDEGGVTAPARATATAAAAGDESAPASGASTPLLPGTRSSSQRAVAPPATATSTRGVAAEAAEGAVDPVHVYDYVFDLAPDSSSDAYYHGAHPPPPARVVRTVLRATQRKPFVDPAGFSTAQLEALTTKLWDEEGKGLSIFFGESSSSSAAAGGQKRKGGGGGGGQPLSRDQERYQREVNAEAQDEWEMAVIAGFSARCDQQIEQNLRRRPITAREMQAQARQQQQQQGPPSAGSMPGQPISMQPQPAPLVSSSEPSTSGAPVSAPAGPTSAPASAPAPAPAPASVPPPPLSSYAALPSSVGYGMTAAVDYATQHQRAAEARYGMQGATTGGSAGVGGAGGAAGWRW